MIRTCMSVVLVAGISGCASVVDLPTGYKVGEEEGEGLAIVSLTLSGKSLDELSSLEYRIREVARPSYLPVEVRMNTDTARQRAKWVAEGGDRPKVGRKVMVAGPNSGEPLDIGSADTRRGRVAALPLPAGTYEFHAWEAREPTQYGSLEYRPRQDFSYRFVVRPGQATYIGELDLDLGEPDAYRVTVEDRSARDLSLLKKKMPAVALYDVSIEIGRVVP